MEADFPSDSRSLGMGGTGVASARSVHAPHFNPALLSQSGQSDVFGLLLPQLGFMALDEDDLYESVTDFVDADYVQRFETNIDNITTRLS